MSNHSGPAKPVRTNGMQRGVANTTGIDRRAVLVATAGVVASGLGPSAAAP